MEEVSYSLQDGHDGCIGVWFWFYLLRRGLREPSGRSFSSKGEFVFLVNINDGGREPDPRLPDVNLITRMSNGGECNWLLNRREDGLQWPQHATYFGAPNFSLLPRLKQVDLRYANVRPKGC